MSYRLRRLGRPERGYSLIELITVAALIGALAAISGIFLLAYRKAIAADSAASELAAAVRETRARAMAERNTYQMILFRRPSADSDAYVVLRYVNTARNVVAGGTPYETTARVMRRAELPPDYRFQPFPSSSDAFVPPPTVLGLSGVTFTTNTFTFLESLGIDLGTSGESAILTFKSDGMIIYTPPNADPTSNFRNTPFNGVIFLTPALGGTDRSRSLRARALTIFGLTGRVTMWKNAAHGVNTGVWVCGDREAMS